MKRTDLGDDFEFESTETCWLKRVKTRKNSIRSLDFVCRYSWTLLLRGSKVEKFLEGEFVLDMSIVRYRSCGQLCGDVKLAGKYMNLKLIQTGEELSYE